MHRLGKAVLGIIWLAGVATATGQTPESGSAQPSPTAEHSVQAAQPADEAAAPAAEGQPATDEPLSVKPKSLWRFDVYAWVWMPAVTGTVGVRRLNVDIDASVSDILEDSDSIFGLSGRFEIGYGKIAGYVDAFYADLGMNDQSGPPGFAAVDVSSQETVVDFGLMYRVGEWEPTGKAAGNRRKMAVDVYAGGRYADLDVTIDPARTSSRSRQEDWIDPLIGARFVLPMWERWNLSVNGDIGGFGVSSDLTWSATGVFGYDFHIAKVPSTVYFGYRAVAWDYTTGDGRDRFEWDVIQHGLLLGLAVQF